MKTDLDCIPCFFKQALDAAKLAGANRALQKKILNSLSKEILKFRLDSCPSLMGRTLYALVIKTTGRKDPFKELKRRSNKSAMALYPRLKRIVERSKDRLLTAVELAIAGNIIDYGVKGAFNINKEIEKIFVEEDKVIRREKRNLFAYPALKSALGRARRILYIGDNAGEVVFDRILIEEMKGKKVIYVVKGAPIINDALRDDALFCGMDKYTRIVSSGCDAPGTLLDLCSRDFLRIYKDAELIISKGQGNFEALADEKRPIFFLFRAKCPVITKHLGCKLGDIILKKTN